MLNIDDSWYFLNSRSYNYLSKTEEARNVFKHKCWNNQFVRYEKELNCTMRKIPGHYFL